MFFNSKGSEEVTYDAIVVGSGISGGWAAKELSEKGLKTLVLERGRDVKQGEYPTANLEAWDLPNRGQLTEEEWKEYEISRRTGYTMSNFTKHWWVNDKEFPYTEKKPFDWIRGYHVGGRSLLWGRQSYRLSDIDFEANAKEGIAVDWPIRYADIEPWYSYVEKYIGVSGRKEGHVQTPDGHFQPAMDFTCLEDHVSKSIRKNFSDRLMTIGRTAHITAPGGHNGRGTCQYRNRCMRGCPFGAYFSSNASTLPAGYASGNLTMRPFSLVQEVIYDPETKKAKGVRILDTETMKTHEFYSKIIFLNASAFHSAKILMQSKSDRFPDGMGNDSGELGHNVMDHHFHVGARAKYEGFQDKYYKGRRPNGIYVPRFRNLDAQSKNKNFLRGYGYQGGANRGRFWRAAEEAKFGVELKTALTKPGGWTMNFLGFGECLPYHDNKITLNHEVKDKFGQSTLTMDVEWKENELVMRKDMQQQAAEMLDASGCKDIEMYEDQSNPGNGIHEMGTARMGRNPKTSILNKWNQIHAVQNVFMTDGACMTSAANQNPSLTYMALTARAANHAVEELKKGNL